MKNENEHGYYSYVLNKPFKTVEELDEAEEAYRNALEAKKNEKLVRSEDAAKVQDAANAYLALVKKNNEIRENLNKEQEESYEAYHKMLDDFDAKHSGYRLEYRQNGDNVEFKVEEAKADTLEDIIAERNKFIKNFFNSFWF